MISTRLDKSSMKAVIDRRYPLERAAEAHAYVDTGRRRGFVVLTVDHGDCSDKPQ